MIGAIIGDIVGSRFEFNNHRSKDFELFTPGCFFTDDTVMTLAVANALMDFRDKRYECLPEKVIESMQKLGRRYPGAGYGGSFGLWIFSNDPTPYGSYGNGAAMRISPTAYVARTDHELSHLVKLVTGVTHNSREGFKGADATAACVWRALPAREGVAKSDQGWGKEKLRSMVERFYYPLDFTLDEIRETYRFNETCQGTVPQAIEAFLESTDFEDAIRNAISIGGDSDTLACITGSIAGAYYGVPKELEEKALSYLTPDLRLILDSFREKYGGRL